jgi:hypothetical protein
MNIISDLIHRINKKISRFILLVITDLWVTWLILIFNQVIPPP